MSDLIATIIRAEQHQFIGWLGGDPQIKYLPSGSIVANVRLGVPRGRDQESDWFSLEVWGEQGQSLADQCRKGSKIAVMGRVKTNRWTTQQGEERTDLIVTVETWKPLDQPAPAAPAAAATAPPAPAPTPAAAPAPTAAPTAFEEPPF